MKMRIEVYQRCGGNVRVVLHGQNTGDAAAGDPGVFARYLEIWRAFSGAQNPQLTVAATDSQSGLRSPAASAVSG
jgi:hypothetical protein